MLKRVVREYNRRLTLTGLYPVEPSPCPPGLDPDEWVITWRKVHHATFAAHAQAGRVKFEVI